MKENLLPICFMEDHPPSNLPDSGEVEGYGLPVRQWRPAAIKEWKSLGRGESVELREGHNVACEGWVDDLTEDGTIIWIHLSNGMGRKMIHLDDDVEIWSMDAQMCLRAQLAQ